MGMPELERGIEAARGDARSFFAGPRDAALVAAAEAALGLALPPTYRRFVSELGAGNAGSHEFYGITTDNFISASVPNGIWLTLSEREQLGLPSVLVIVGEDGLGGYYVLDTSQKDANGESPVAIWKTGGGNLAPFANDFGAFFLQAVVEELGE